MQQKFMQDLQKIYDELLIQTARITLTILDYQQGTDILKANEVVDNFFKLPLNFGHIIEGYL